MVISIQLCWYPVTMVTEMYKGRQERELLYNYLAACSRRGKFFNSVALFCRGGNENSLTVELPLRISFTARSADNVSFMYMLSIFSISASSLGTLSCFCLLSVAALGSFPSSLLVASGQPDGSSFLEKRLSSTHSHSFTRLLSTSVEKNGSCKTFWIKGRRTRAPLRLSYFFSIFTNPVYIISRLLLGKKRNVHYVVRI